MSDNDLANILSKAIIYTREAVEDAEKAIELFDGSNEDLEIVNSVLNSFGDRIGKAHQILQKISQQQNLPAEIEYLVKELEALS